MSPKTGSEPNFVANLLPPFGKRTNVHRSYAIPGHRLGGLVASPTFLSQLSKLLDCIQICPARPAQRAVEWALTGLAEWRQQTREELQRRQRVFRELVESEVGMGWEVATGGAYFAYVCAYFIS